MQTQGQDRSSLYAVASDQVVIYRTLIRMTECRVHRVLRVMLPMWSVMALIHSSGVDIHVAHPGL